MITRQTKLQLLVFALIALAGLTYTGAKYAGLGKYFYNEGYVVSADFPDSGGIFDGAEVTYRGVPVGKVEGLTLLPDGVRVGLKLRTGTEVPAGTRAVVGNRSAVGEQFVDLQPRREGRPFMEEGDVIAQADTEIPIQPTQLLVNLDDFVTSLDTEDVAVVLEELGNAFEGAGDDLQRLVDEGDTLTRAATDALPETITLIRDGETVLNTQRDVSGQFRSFNRDLAALTEQLRASDPDFRSLFANGTTSADEVRDLVEKNRTDLPLLLQNLTTVAQIQKVRLPALRQILVTYPNVVAGGFTVAPGDGTAHFGLVETGDPDPCTAGYDSPAEKQPPSDVTASGLASVPPNLDRYCAEPNTSPKSVRGARSTPRPPGVAPFPDDRPRSAAAGSVGRPALDAQGSSTVLGDYDPSTGRAITADGARVSIGSTAGAATVFGDRSWQWMLLGPLSGS